MLKNALIGVGLIAAFGVAYIRYAPLYPNQWHVDPAEAVRTGKPNDFLMSEGGDLPPVVLVADCRAVGFFAMAMRPSAGMMVPAGKV